MHEIRTREMGLKPSEWRPFLRDTVYHKPTDISLRNANDMLVTFAFTRHPFIRLASSYYHKFKHHLDDPEIREISNKIMFMYRDLDTNRSNAYPPPKVFATYLLDLAKQYGPLSFNRHWRPQYALCPFCSLNFDYIADIEDMDTHVEYLGELLGVTVIFEIRNFIT